MGNWHGCVGFCDNAAEDEWNDAYRRSSIRDESLTHSSGDPRFASGIMVQRSSDMKISHVNQYELVDQLGKGAFGDVFLGKAAGKSYAIKVLKKSALLRKRQGKFGSALDTVKSEIALMKKIKHPNCVGMVEVIDDPASDEVFIVLDFVDGGPSQPIGRNGAPIVLKESLIWSYTRHLLLGLEYLHMNAIVHRDLKPDNLLISRKERGMLKIADFGTALFVETSEGSRTAGTPAFFSPELCAAGAASLVDGRASDMWAVGVTLHLWAYGRAPFMAATPMLVMEKILNCEPCVEPPPDRRVSAGLRAVISGCLTRDVRARMTLNQLRLHSWLSKGGRAPLIEQPGGFVQVSSADVAQAITQPMQVSGHLGALEREGGTSIVKRSIRAEYAFYERVAASEIAPYVPILYGLKQERVLRPSRRSSLRSNDDSSSIPWISSSRRGSRGSEPSAPQPSAQPTDECRFVMQDLTAGMRYPCVMDIKMGTHTTLQLDEADRTPREDLLRKMDKIDAHAATADERRAGGVSKARYLAYRDSVTSTSTLGFRIDAAVTSRVGGQRGVPLDNVRFSDLKEEAQVRAALAQFLGHSQVVAKAVLIKLQRMRAALERSDFFARHVFVRSSILVTYDELAHTRLLEGDGSSAEELLSLTSPAALEVKMIDFAHVHEVPDGRTVTHRATRSADPSEDGYLTGLDSLISTLERVLAHL